MMSDTPRSKSGIREHIEFLEMIEEAAEERATAYEVRETDPERWKSAKQAYADLRRGIRVWAGRTGEDPTVSISSAATNVSIEEEG